MSKDVTSARDDKSLVKESGLTSIAAAASIASGLGLQIAITAAFGVGAATDAFFVAARIPLGLVQIAVVVANQALVPKFASWLVRRRDGDTWRLVSTVIAGTSALGLVGAIVAILVPDLLVRLVAAGLSPDDAQLAASMVGLMFLIVPLTACAEVLRALLNARRSFVVPAALHTVLNIVAAGVTLGFADRGVQAVAWGYVAGSAAQLLLMLWLARRDGFRLSRQLAVWDPEIEATARLTVRPALGAVLVPIARVGEVQAASLLPTGSITILSYGTLLINAIGGTVFFRSIIVTLMPRLAAATTRGDTDAVRRNVNLGVKLMLVISLPLTAFMAVLGQPAVALVFRLGDFTAENAQLLGLVLVVYSTSLVGSAVQRALLAPFYAALDTRTPLRNAVYGVAVNMLVLFPLVLPFTDSELGVLGIAAAYCIAQYVNVAHAWWRLRDRDLLAMRRLRGFALSVTLASMASGGTMFAIARATGLDITAGRLELLLHSAVIGLVGAVVLVGMIWVLAAEELRKLRTEARRRAPAAPVAVSGGQSKRTS